MNNQENIILIGFMGCGKTTFGKWLAEYCQMTFLDTDAYIEQQQNRLIKDIFASEGEEYFRDLETAAIRAFGSGCHRAVVSVGGGLPLREENRRLLGALGTVVYLRTSKEELAHRLRKDRTRPLLAEGNVEEKIQQLMADREEIYQDAADWVIDTDGQTFEDMYDKLTQRDSEICSKKII